LKQSFSAGKALLIGIGQGYPGTLKLPSVVRHDAEVVARVLTDSTLCGYPPENLQVLLDEQATRSNIVEGLKKLAIMAKPDDTVFFFFSGHGAQRTIGDDAGTYICPVDFDSDDPCGTGIKADELSTLISGIQAARVVVILDACHAEGALFLKDADQEKSFRFGFNNAGLEKLATGAGRIVVSSCKDYETSRTYVEKDHSLFTYFLLEGLRGAAMDRGDGVIRVLDLFHYVADEVPRHKRNGHQQHPVLKAHAESNFPLALRKGGWFKGPETRAQSSKVVSDVRQLEHMLCQLYPSGPEHNEVWSRAGGDQSTLTFSGSGRASWHAALRMLSQGGGGQDISLNSLLETALSDFPNNPDLKSLTS
jgi:hypothetical protein